MDSSLPSRLRECNDVGGPTGDANLSLSEELPTTARQRHAYKLLTRQPGTANIRCILTTQTARIICPKYEFTPPPCTAVSYFFFTYLLPDGYPGTRQATWSGTRVTNYPIAAALVTTRCQATAAAVDGK